MKTMRKQWLQLLGSIAAGSFWVTGCACSHTTLVREPATLYYPKGELVLREPVLEPRRESEGVAPDRMFVWVPGYWTGANQKWVWIVGHWETPAPR